MRIRDLPPGASTRASALPRFLPGGDVGVLLLHGFTGTPRDFAGMADHLRSAGFTVSVPRLPGHGTIGMDFLQAGWRDWLRSSVDAWLDLRARCATVHVVGHSMGGVLAALLASHFPVTRLVLLAPAFKFNNRLLPWSPVIGLFIRRLRWNVTAEEVPHDADAAALSREYWQWRYPRQGASYLRIRRIAVRGLSRVNSPTLVILGTGDRNVPSTVMSFLSRHMRRAELRLLSCQGSSHLLLSGPDARDINEKVGAWLLSVGRPFANAPVG